jgi:hypothetical protein
VIVADRSGDHVPSTVDLQAHEEEGWGKNSPDLFFSFSEFLGVAVERAVCL